MGPRPLTGPRKPGLLGLGRWAGPDSPRTLEEASELCYKYVLDAGRVFKTSILGKLVDRIEPTAFEDHP